MYTCGKINGQWILFFWVGLCSFLWIDSYSQAFISQEVLPAPSITSISTYSLSEGLPDNCISDGFLDSKGRLWLNPCSYTIVDRGIGFFQYDGKQAFFYPIKADSLFAGEEGLKWRVEGELKNGFLFGQAVDHPFIFMWHPDTREQRFYSFNSNEQLLNIKKNPGGGLLVLVQKSDSCLIYGLNQANKKEKLAEFRSKNQYAKDFLFSISLEIHHQKAWFFVPFEGLAGLDLEKNETFYYSFQDLVGEPIKFRGTSELDLNEGTALINAYKSDELLLYLGVHQGFYTFHILSQKLSPFLKLNQFLKSANLPERMSISINQDSSHNLLINFGFLENVLSSNHRLKNYLNLLLDQDGQLINYTDLINTMSGFAQNKSVSIWVGNFFGHNFKQQLGWASLGGLIISELRMESSGINAYPLALGIRAMALLDSNRLYFNTDTRDYILNIRDGTFDEVPLDVMISNFQSNIIFSEDQILWVAGRQKLLRYNPAIGSTDFHELGIDFEKFTLISNTEIAFFSPTGELYFYNVDLKQKRSFTFQDSIFSVKSEVNELYYSNEGMLWVAAKNGLWKFDIKNNQVHSFASTNDFLDVHITSIHLGENEKLWLGTFDAGVLILDLATNKVEQISKVDGLSNNTVTGILSDEEGNRWISTYDGITVLSPTGEVLFDLSQENGLTSNEFNRTSYVKFPDGRMAFGGVTGINILEPPKIKEAFIDRTPLNIFLTSHTYYSNEAGKNLVLEGDYISPQAINIPAANRYLILDFSISEYADRSKHTYAYRLVPGWDRDQSHENIPWINLGPASELTLNNLPVGDYIVQIRGIDHKGRTTATPLQIPIHVEQFFYRTWWFYALCSLPFLLGAWIWIRRILTERKRLKIEVEKRTKEIRLDKEIIARQVEELQQFDQAKSRFFANISHELRTPLTIILGMIEQIDKQPKRWLNKGVKMIRNNGSNLLELVNQILELQKLESGNLSVNLQLDDIIPFLKSIFNQFEALAVSKSLQMEFISEMESLDMDYDQEKILRIVSNLLSNAIKYTPEKGKVNFTISSGKIGESVQEDHLILTVEDTGHGIHHEELPYIFDRFFQASSQEKIINSGTGIGLSLTQELVKLLNGKIEVFSQLGQGTTFQVFLPITQKANPGQRKDQLNIQAAVLGTQGPPEKEKIAAEDLPLALIVEDNVDIAQYLQICLEGSYRMHFARNGQEGIDQALEQVPDIIVSDVMMPEKNGFELCETLNEDIRTSHIPIILLTAKSDVDSRIAGLKKGADDYLAKPFHEEELLIRMKNLLDIRLKLQKRYQNLFDQAPMIEEPEVSKEDEFMLKFKEIIEPQLSDPDFDSEKLTQALFMSRSHLSRKIKALTGRSLGIYIRSLRLQKARHLLLTSDLSIKEIGYEVGLYNPTYFSRTYQEEFGESPSKTREIH